MTPTIFNKIFLVVFVVLIAFSVYLKKDAILGRSYLGNLHMHTTCSDGESGYEEMIRSAVAMKFSFVALSDHTICPDMARLCAAETRILCIPSQEVTGDRVHLLAINVRQYVNQHMSLARQVEEIHKQGGIAIAAHPNAKNFYYTDTELTGSGIDAMECTSNINERRPLTCVWDSDAHNTFDLGWQFMSCTKPVKSFEDIKSVIFSRSCSRETTLPFTTPKNAKETL